MRILPKLYLGYAALVLVATGAMGFFADRWLAADSVQQLERDLETQALFLSELASQPLETGRGAHRIGERVTQTGKTTHTRLTVLRADGSVLADSVFEPSAMDNHANRPEILEATRVGGTVTQIRYSHTAKQDVLYSARPVVVEGRTVGHVRASVTLGAVEQRLWLLRGRILMGAALAMIVALLGGYLLARSMTEPLTAMTSAARRLAAGDTDVELPVRHERDELGTLSRALSTMATDLQERLVSLESDRSKLRVLEDHRRDFVANVSHELKTPLTAIYGLVDTMLEDPDMAPATRRRFLGKVHKQASRLSTLVKDILTLSKLESGSDGLQREAFDLRDAVQESARLLAGSSAGEKVLVDVELPDESIDVVGDREALRQVIDNLLNNAVKYTAEGGHVWIRLRAEGRNSILEVQDTGVGIPPRALERIFERFFRVDKARSRELGGTGLGLSIVKHVALSHGGEVSVESQVGEGSTFRVTLPLVVGRTLAGLQPASQGA